VVPGLSPCRINGPKGFTVVGIAMDEGEVRRRALTKSFDVDGQKLPMNYPILPAPQRPTNSAVSRLPQQFPDLRDGKIVTKFRLKRKKNSPRPSSRNSKGTRACSEHDFQKKADLAFEDLKKRLPESGR
jgi:hypothetical protein